MAELNERLASIDAGGDERVLRGRLTSIGFNFEQEKGELLPLPGEDFECGLTLTPKVDRSSRITVRQCHYSVPARFIGRRVRVLLRGNELLVFDRRTVIAHHPRLTRRYDSRDDLLCQDEFGYLDLDKTEREERRAIAIASNAPFSEWKQTFTDPRLCAAILDRVTFNAHILETGTDSYRLAQTQETRRHT